MSERSREIYIELHTVVLLLFTFAIILQYCERKNGHGIDEKYHTSWIKPC